MINQPVPPNGFEFHAVHDTVLDVPNLTLTVMVGSWSGEDTKANPMASRTLVFSFDDWQPDYLNQVEDYVNGCPEWSGEGPAKPNEHCVFHVPTKTWADPRTAETQWAAVRAERNRKIAATDWTQLPDVPLDTKAAWAAYRQALRDITGQPDPFNIVWPIPPTP